MRIDVTCTGQLAMLTGRINRQVEVEAGETLTSLLRKVADAENEEFRSIVFQDNGCVRTSIMIAVDGEEVNSPDLHVLEESAKVMIMTPMLV